MLIANKLCIKVYPIYLLFWPFPKIWFIFAALILTTWPSNLLKYCLISLSIPSNLSICLSRISEILSKLSEGREGQGTGRILRMPLESFKRRRPMMIRSMERSTVSSPLGKYNDAQGLRQALLIPELDNILTQWKRVCLILFLALP